MICTKCKVDRPLARFNTKQSGQDRSDRKNLRMPCRDCVSQRLSTPEQRAKKAERLREWRRQNPEKAWAKRLKQFGLTPERYAALLDAQGGTCQLCRKPPGAKRLAVDHDHACCPGVTSCGSCVRGLLCVPCNAGIGFLGESPEVLGRAIEYLAHYAPMEIEEPVDG